MQGGDAVLGNVNGHGHIYVHETKGGPKSGTGEFVPYDSDPTAIANLIPGPPLEFRGPIHIDGEWKVGRVHVILVRTSMANSIRISLATTGAPTFD